jgi:hypothetical protein
VLIQPMTLTGAKPASHLTVPQQLPLGILAWPVDESRTPVEISAKGVGAPASGPERFENPTCSGRAGGRRSNFAEICEGIKGAAAYFASVNSTHAVRLLSGQT